MHNIATAFDTAFEISWNFNGSCHSKSEAEDEAADVKNAFYRRAKFEQLTLTDGRDCFNFLTSFDLACSETNGSLRHFYYTDSALIKCERQAATQVCAIPKVRTIRQVQSIFDQHAKITENCHAEIFIHGGIPWKLLNNPGREYIKYAFLPIPANTFQCSFQTVGNFRTSIQSTGDDLLLVSSFCFKSLVVYCFILKLKSSIGYFLFYVFDQTFCERFTTFQQAQHKQRKEAHFNELASIALTKFPSIAFSNWQ